MNYFGNKSKTRLKCIILVINPKNLQEDPHLYLMTRKCAKPNFHQTSLVVGILGQNETYFLYFGPSPLVLAPLISPTSRRIPVEL